MPQIVQPHPRQPGLLGEILEAIQYPIRPQRRPVDPSEHQAVVLVRLSPLSALDSLTRSLPLGLASPKWDLVTIHRFFMRALVHGRCPTKVTTDRAAAYPESEPITGVWRPGCGRCVV